MADIMGRSSLEPACLVPPQGRDQRGYNRYRSWRGRDGYSPVSSWGNIHGYPPPHISFLILLVCSDQTGPDQRHGGVTRRSTSGPHSTESMHPICLLLPTAADLVFGKALLFSAETPYSMPRAARVEHLRQRARFPSIFLLYLHSRA